jgi:tripartite-type tricarboxylate transporter receptor subunit TctC
MRRRTFVAASAALWAEAAPAQQPDALPARALRIIVPFAPGGSTDIISRLIAGPMMQRLGQPVVVENRPGANGLVALEAVARARPDGSTAMIGNVTTNGTAPLLAARRLAFAYPQDFAVVARIADVPSVLVATTVNFAAETLADAMAAARRAPGRLNYITTGVGSYVHFDTVLLARAAQVEIVHVPVSAGAGAYFQALANGDVHLGLMNAASAIPLVREGRLRALAVTGDARLPELPSVPTLAQAGFPGIGTSSWHVMLVPGATPPATVRALHEAVAEAVRSDVVQEAFRRQSIQTTLSASPEAGSTWLQAELERWRGVIAETRIEAD